MLVLRDGMIEMYGDKDEVLPKVTRAVSSAQADAEATPPLPKAVQEAG